MRFNVCQSVKELHELCNQVLTRLVGRLCAGIKSTYTGAQLLCLYTFTDMPVVGLSEVELQDPTHHNRGDRCAAAASPWTPITSKLSTSSAN